jgi:hypothetical protein
MTVRAILRADVRLAISAARRPRPGNGCQGLETVLLDAQLAEQLPARELMRDAATGAVGRAPRTGVSSTTPVAG